MTKGTVALSHWDAQANCARVRDRRSAPMAVPNVKSIFDIEPDAAIEARLDAEAEADYAAGRFVPHERVREWLLKLARGEKVPPPEG